MSQGTGRRGAIFALLSAALLAACAPVAGSSVPAASEAWLDARPWPQAAVARTLGQATGVDVDNAGRVYVFHRADRNWVEPFPAEPIGRDTIAVLDADGQLIASWGKNLFIMPHGLSIDRAGNVWVTDVGAHQVRQFTSDGRLLLTLGERGKPGGDRYHFNLPTDVAFGPDGTVYVSDGYGNTRVVRFTADGRYLGEWGVSGKGPGQFNLPHGIAVDRRGRVYVADRENFRLQIFDSTGRYLDEWGTDRVGDPYGVTIGSDGSVYVVDGGFQPDRTRARVVRLTPGGKVLDSFTAAIASDGEVLGHDLAIGRDGTIYLADAWANRVRKLIVP
jgi:peptidylamidoglycolate lyase